MAPPAEPPQDDALRAAPASSSTQALPFWPHAVATAVALVALGYATGRVRAPSTPPEPTVNIPARRPAPAARPQAPAPPEPQVNVPIFELPAAAQRIEWPESAELATFVLSLSGEQQRDEYSLRLRARDGAVVLSAEGLKPTRAASVTLAVPRRFLPPGLYLFELRATGSQPEGAPLRSYPVEIR